MTRTTIACHSTKMNLYYVRFEAEHVDSSGAETTGFLEDIVYARDPAHAEKIISKWFTFANAHDDNLPNIDTIHLLRSHMFRGKGGLASDHVRGHWMYTLQFPYRQPSE